MSNNEGNIDSWFYEMRCHFLVCLLKLMPSDSTTISSLVRNLGNGAKKYQIHDKMLSSGGVLKSQKQ